jgi:hypothetical protein
MTFIFVYMGYVFLKGGQGVGGSSAIPYTSFDTFGRLYASRPVLPSRLFHVKVNHHPAGYLTILQCLTCFVEFGDPYNCRLQAQFAWPCQ